MKLYILSQYIKQSSLNLIIMSPNLNLGSQDVRCEFSDLGMASHRHSSYMQYRCCDVTYAIIVTSG